MVKATRRIKADKEFRENLGASATEKRSTAIAKKKTATPATKIRPPAQTSENKSRGMPSSSASKNPPYEAKESYTPTEARKWIFDICKDLTRDGNKRVFVEDRHGICVVTLDPRKRNLRQPVLNVSIQKFKEQFASYCTLIKIGLCFRITRRGGAQHIYARSHTGYHYPLKEVVKDWLDGLVDQKLGQVTGEVRRLADRDDDRDRELARLDTDIEELKGTHQQLRKGIQRVSLKLPPFIEDPARPHAVPPRIGSADRDDAGDSGGF